MLSVFQFRHFQGGSAWTDRQTDRRVRWALLGKSSKDHRSILRFFFGVAFLATLAACGGGGGGGGGSSPTASSVTGVYTGGTTLAYFHMPVILDEAYASGYSPSSFTLTLNPLGQFSIADDQGNVGGGTYTVSGSSVVISSGSLYLSSACTSSSSNCIYTIKSGSGGLSIGSGNISGTLDFFSSSNSSTPAFSTTLGLSVNSSLPSVSLTSLENQTLYVTFGTVSAPNPSGTPPYNCSSADTLVGTTGLSVNGSTMYFPCITWNTYEDGNMGNSNDPTVCPSSPNSNTFYPCNGTQYKMVMCPNLGSTCYPTSFPSYIPSSSIGYPPLTVPSNALAFYVEATICPSGSCSGAAADAGGYIVPASGSGGGVVGKFVYVSTYCNTTTTDTGTLSIVDG
jgi:hypothetical protein